jgi:DNA-binding NarL/FixJ family response regulator
VRCFGLTMGPALPPHSIRPGGGAWMDGGLIILVADDHALVRQGLVRLLKDAHSDWRFGEAGTLDETIEALSGAPHDLLVIDLNMPGMEGSASLQALREAYPTTRIAVLTGAEDRATILDCLSAGVHGYILKSDAVGHLVEAIETVMRGQVYVPQALTRIVQARPAPQPASATLTPRQFEVLQLLAEGRSTKDIARRLDLGVGTVKVHLAGVYRALGAQNRMEAVVKAGKFKLGS